MKSIRSAIQVVGMFLVAAAIFKELSKPAEERAWHGRLHFSVPYDFRPPTGERWREAYWNPDDDRIFTDKICGVGWAINFYALLRRIGLLA